MKPTFVHCLFEQSGTFKNVFHRAFNDFAGICTQLYLRLYTERALGKQCPDALRLVNFFTNLLTTFQQ